MNNELLIELFRFNHKTDYLPYYTKHHTIFKNDDTILDLLNTLSKNEKFSFNKVEDFGLKINNIYVKSSDLVANIVSKTSNNLIIEPISIYRAIEDLTINNDDFFEKLKFFESYLSQEKIDSYIQELQFEYYASDSLDINKEYIGDHSIIIASDIIAFDSSLKSELLKLLSDQNKGIWYHTSKQNRVLANNIHYKNKIDAMIQEVTQYQAADKISEQNNLNTISQKFTDFNIAVHDVDDTKTIEQLIVKSDAKYINTTSKNNDLALHSQSVNKAFSYKIAGDILLEAKDNNADFLVIKDDNTFKIFDNKQKEIEKVIGRDIQLPIITLTQFNTLLSGEKDRKALGFNNHKVAIPFL